ncbi:MAG: membrane dipeptidase [Clostridiaceae bacterium]|nr:membrane dipeptidase [Clostridiaceae bacterium]
MLIFDAHCDILSKINSEEELFNNNHHWDAERALALGPFIQVFSAFNEIFPRNIAGVNMKKQIQMALSIEAKYPDRFKIIRSKDDLDKCIMECSRQKVYGILEAEGAEILGGSLEEFERLYFLGLRILTLCWNYDNDICDSVAGENPHNGLSEFGKKVIDKADSLGVLIDVSHASDKTFEDVLSMTKRPVTASHSNARALCSHNRNLTDRQIKAIARSGGVIGINFYSFFLENSGNAHILDIIRHIEYIASLVGTEYIGFGADFDGIEVMPSEMNGVESMYDIINELLRLNYPEDDVKAIAGGNFVRLMGQFLPSLHS